VNLDSCTIKFLWEKFEDFDLGFRISHSGFSKSIYCKSRSEFEDWILKLKKLCLQLNFDDEYEMRKQLGTGHFSTVYEGISKRSGERVAVKVIKKEKMMISQKHIVHFLDSLFILDNTEK